MTWVGNDANTPAAQYAVYDGATLRGTVTVDQKTSPAQSKVFTDAGWQSLGWFYVGGRMLVVKLTNGDGGTLVADGVKIVQVTPTITSYDSLGNMQYVTVGSGRRSLPLHGLHL